MAVTSEPHAQDPPMQIKAVFSLDRLASDAASDSCRKKFSSCSCFVNIFKRLNVILNLNGA
jgi:hypothetical protein